MRVLITNNSLSARAGTELVVYEIGRELRRRGHEVAAYSSTLGEVAELMVGSSIPVVNQPEACPFQPNIIHGQHHLDAMTALLAFPNTPAVYHTHGGVPWVERPPVHPRILHYIAMCEDLADVTRINLGLQRDQVTALPNWVDLNRFRGNHQPPAKPERAVLFGGGLGDPAMVAKLRPAFEPLGIRLDSTADWTETDRRTPELALPRYDIALASGRSALEAMASGCAVIIANHESSTGWVRPDNFAMLKRQNFAPKRPDPGFDASTIQTFLSAYDAESARKVTLMTREQCELIRAVDRLLELYETTVRSWTQRQKAARDWELERAEEDRKAALNYLRQLAVAVRDVEALHVTNRRNQKQIESYARAKEKLANEIGHLEKKLSRTGNDVQLVNQLRRHWLGRIALSWCGRRARN
ncbi:glycosyltransferase [Verrucomicrobium spinosum]|uniref:glycosyltransferase n=1 Tax=Verrucomicrobium spinosum TaxID=2736 RepID=UPI0001745B82|nr:glycosyltransferase [Verrucomicrobium spinosum]